MSEELDALTDKLLEVSAKLRATESELAELRAKHQTELSKFAHDLKNPLGAISSFVEMLQGNRDIDDEKVFKYLEIIHSSSKFSLDLVNSFQEYNKLQNTPLEFEIQTENYLEIVRKVISEVSKKAKDRRQEVLLSAASSDVISCAIDSVYCHKVLSMVLDNALRFSKEHSEVLVDVLETESSIVTTISDSGIGISEKDLPKITHSFFTVDTYDVHREKCIGLGLTKASIILNEMGGVISFLSEEGKGTQVKLILKKG